ncbi:MAG TPA: lipocalin [Flavobacteriales bacterium]|jgi:apolipoprotein D and lipocalin family protein|nr:lipocalin family protein [Flavobacteriales bacterium]HAW21237.1 lipocalin [Flavobacteriales bacterium]
MKIPSILFALTLSFIFSGCSTIPDDIVAVEEFDITKYAGTWYEIARMDSRFEKGLVDVTATYTMLDDGKIEVLNRGLDTLKNEWSDIVGKARLANDEGSAMLEVSFFGPFYAGYNVVEIADNYSYALVCGASKDYLWILARDAKLAPSIKEALISRAKELGFETDQLVMVPHAANAE